jgi:hypothetical protein
MTDDSACTQIADEGGSQELSVTGTSVVLELPSIAFSLTTSRFGFERRRKSTHIPEEIEEDKVTDGRRFLWALGLEIKDGMFSSTHLSEHKIVDVSRLASSIHRLSLQSLAIRYCSLITSHKVSCLVPSDNIAKSFTNTRGLTRTLAEEHL